MSTWRTTALITLLVVATAAVAQAQQTLDEKVAAGKWGAELRLGANLLQSYYTDNWNGGDTGSIVWNGTLDAQAQKQFGANWRWYNTLNLAYGQNHQQERDGDELRWRKPDKTTDRFDAETIMRNNATKWGPYLGVRFQSRFYDQTDPRGDLTMNPLEFFETLGISRLMVDTEQKKFFFRLGATAHQMIRDMYLDEAFSVDPVNETASDIGLEIVFNYVDKELAERIEYTGQLRFYQALYYSAKQDLEDLDAGYLESVGLPTDLADYTTVLDIDWENTFTASITKVINVQFYVRWIYDKYDNTVKPVVVDGVMHNIAGVNGSIRKAGQFKQTMSLGLAYTF